MPSISDVFNTYKKFGGYSGYTKFANSKTDGWFSTIAGATPIYSNVHNLMLEREKTKDYLKNNNLDWSDVEGYNAEKLTGSSSRDLSSIGGSVRYLNNIAGDLGKLYSEQKDKKK